MMGAQRQEPLRQGHRCTSGCVCRCCGPCVWTDTTPPLQDWLRSPLAEQWETWRLEYKCHRVHDLADCSSFFCRVNVPFSSPGKLVAWSIPEVLPRYLSKLNSRLFNTDLFLIKLQSKCKVLLGWCLPQFGKAKPSYSLLYAHLLTPNFLYLYRFPWSFPLYLPASVTPSATPRGRSLPRKFTQSCNVRLIPSYRCLCPVGR